MECVPPFAPDWCFFLDVDGTLVDIAERPALVLVDASLQNLLQRLAAQTKGAVALISGRSLADIDSLFSAVRLPAAGQHGLERRDILGNIHVFQYAEQVLRHATLDLEKLAAQYPALELEHKGMAVAMHYRRAPHLAPVVASAMQELLDRLGEGYELLQGKMVFEVKPDAKNKGTAVAEFMQEDPFKGRIPVYIGDDTTDESAFKVVNKLRGHTLKVGDGATQAHGRLADANAVRAWLMAFVEQNTSASI